MFDYVKYFHGFLDRTVLRLLRYDQIDVHVRVDKVTVRGPSHGPLDSHQAMFLGPLKDRFAVQILTVPGIVDVGANPTDVLASSKAPFAQTETSHVQSIAAAAP